MFFDTSVLLPGLVELASPEASPQRLLHGVAEGVIAQPLTAWHCCLEFYAVSTRLPLDLRIEPDEALRLLEHEVFPRFRVVQLPPDAWQAFLMGAAAERIAGGRLYDAHIAEVARASEATLVVTENRRHFTSLLRYEVRVLTAQEAVEELGL